MTNVETENVSEVAVPIPQVEPVVPYIGEEPGELQRKELHRDLGNGRLAAAASAGSPPPGSYSSHLAYGNAAIARTLIQPLASTNTLSEKALKSKR